MRPAYSPRASYYAVPEDASWERFNVDCRQISKNENVGGWVQPGRWHILTFHGIGGEHDGWEPIPVQQFAMQMAELARLRDSGAVEIVTFKDGASRLRQLERPRDQSRARRAIAKMQALLTTGDPQNRKPGTQSGPHDEVNGGLAS